MEEKQIHAEDVDAFEDWMDRHAGNIKRFAIQYGCTREQARNVTEETFRSLYTNLHRRTEEELPQITPYQLVLEKLGKIKQADSLDTSFLPFEEDRQLHEKIIQLERNMKSSLILSRFHNVEDMDIAMLLGISTEAVNNAIDEAIQQLAEGHDSLRLTKQLEFLNMSYGRIRTSFRKDQVFVEEVEIAEETVKRRKPKKGMIPWMVGILILLSLIVTSVVTSEGYQKTSAEKYMERLKESFEDDMATRFAILGLTEPTEEGSQEWHTIYYGKEARMEFQNLVRRHEKELKETGTVNRKDIKEEYAVIIDTLALPSEMVEQLVKNPLTDDKEQSEAFVKAYVERYYEFQHAYQMLFSDYQEAIEQSIVDGQIDLEKLLENRETYPEELQKALEGMKTQNIYPTVIPQWSTIIPTFQKNEISAQFRASLHEDLGGYVTLLESTPFVYYPNLAYSLDDSVEYLLDMEKTLLTTQMDEGLYFSLNHAYMELLFELVGGSDPERLVERDGRVKAEVQSAWRKIASNKKQSPSSVIVNKIIGEMEESDWITSESQSRLTVHHVSYAVKLAQGAQLQNFELTGIIPSGEDMEFVALPDAQFERQVEETYELFSVEHDLALLQEVHPLTIFAMYAVANDREDPETMWHLYKPDDASQTLEEYVHGWEKEKIDLSQIDNLLFHNFGSRTGSIGLERGHSSSFGIEMKEDEEKIWRIKYIHQDSTFFE